MDQSSLAAKAASSSLVPNHGAELMRLLLLRLGRFSFRIQDRAHVHGVIDLPDGDLD